MMEKWQRCLSIGSSFVRRCSSTMPSQATGDGQQQQLPPRIPRVDTRWRIVSSVCVQRFPILVPVKTPLEKRYAQHKEAVNLRRSRLSDYEIEEKQYWDHKAAREKKAQEEDLDASEVAAMEKEAIFEEMEESRTVELQSFNPRPRNDESADSQLKSMNRKMTDMLYLLVKKHRDEFSWQFPQGGVEGEESLIEAAARELGEECGSSLNVHFLSNSPVAYYSYSHANLQPGQKGTKVFFFKAQYRNGTVTLDPNELVDYVWVTTDEMKDYLSEDYYNAIAPALLS